MNTLKISEILKGKWLKTAMASIAVAVILLFASSPAVHAQAVSWEQIDLGAVGAAGTYSYASGSPPTFTIAGAGTGIGYTSDIQTFVYTSACGNTEMQAKVTSQSSSASTAMSGLMMRDSLLSNYAAMACIGVTPTGVNFYYRSHAGASTTVTGPAVTAPVYLRLTLNNGVAAGYESSDGIAWTLVGSASNAMPNLYYEGFTVSGASGTLNTAVFTDESFMTSVPQTGSGSNLLLWLRSDVGLTYSGTSISGWADQSGNSNNASSSGTAEPTLVTGALNNAVLPAVSFNGTAQQMTLPSDFANLSAGYSSFIVLEPTSSTATGNPCTIGNTSNSDAVFPQTSGTKASLFAYNGTTSSSTTTATGVLSNSSYQLLEETFQPGASANTGIGTILVNGVQKKQSTTMVQNLNNITRSANFVGSGIGSTNYFKGNIAEILLYSAPLTSSQRAMVESYVLSKYAVGNTPTLDVPTFSPQSSVVLPKQVVTMSQDQNATIYWTGNGTTPSTSSQWLDAAPLYLPSANGLNVNSETINAIGVAPFFNNSTVASSVYQIDPTTTAISRNGLIAWFRADNGATVSSGKVTSWADMSGSGNTASQGTSAKQPTFVSSAINGLPALQFNGTSTFLQLPSGLSNFSSGASVFIITKPTAVTAGARFFDFGNGATADNLYMDEPTNTGASLYTYNGSSGTSVTSSSAITLNQFQLLEAIDNGTGTGTILTNAVQGMQNTSMNTLNNITRANDYIGQASAGGSYFKGYIAEILCYNRGVTAQEQSAIEGYLLSKYQALNANTTTAPVLSVAAGTLTAPTQVAIWAPEGSTVYYTITGSNPTTSSPVYSAPINVYYTQTVKAMCVLNGVQSAVTSNAYTLNSTQYPAPSTTDTTPLQIQLQLPKVSIPEDSNQH